MSFSHGQQGMHCNYAIISAAGCVIGQSGLVLPLAGSYQLKNHPGTFYGVINLASSQQPTSGPLTGYDGTNTSGNPIFNATGMANGQYLPELPFGTLFYTGLLFVLAFTPASPGFKVLFV